MLHFHDLLLSRTGYLMKRKLHIGGKQKAEGWEILNANAAPEVDHACNATDLSLFPDGTFSEIYASHIVEHFDYQNELAATLKEWFRVMEPGGKIYISVPDMDILASLLVNKKNYTLNERFEVMRMLFGGHVDQYDYHVVGLNEEFLSVYLRRTGLINLRKVTEFSLFKDTSSYKFKGVAISLNIIAEKPS